MIVELPMDRGDALETAWHATSIERVGTLLETGPRGPSAMVAAARLIADGPSALAPPPTLSNVAAARRRHRARVAGDRHALAGVRQRTAPVPAATIRFCVAAVVGTVLVTEMTNQAVVICQRRP